MTAERRFFEHVSGFAPAVQAQGLTIRPEFSAVVIRFPYGGFVWNRPSGVIVDDGQAERRIAIVDPTRIIVLALAALAVGTEIAATVYRIKIAMSR